MIKNKKREVIEKAVFNTRCFIASILYTFFLLCNNIIEALNFHRTFREFKNLK